MVGVNRKLIVRGLLILIPLLIIIPAYAPTTIITDTSVSTNNVFVSQDTNSTRIFESGNRVLTKASSIDDLNDVVITAPTNGQVITFNGTSSKWVNGAAVGGDLQEGNFTTYTKKFVISITNYAGERGISSGSKGEGTTNFDGSILTFKDAANARIAVVKSDGTLVSFQKSLERPDIQPFTTHSIRGKYVAVFNTDFSTLARTITIFKDGQLLQDLNVSDVADSCCVFGGTFIVMSGDGKRLWFVSDSNPGITVGLSSFAILRVALYEGS